MTAEPAWLAQVFARDPEMAGKRPCPCSDHSEPRVRRDLAPMVLATMKANGWANENGRMEVRVQDANRIDSRSPADALLVPGRGGRFVGGTSSNG